MPQMTIVVPLMDQVDDFETTLASVLRYLQPGQQILVAHQGQYEDPHQIFDEVDELVVSGRVHSMLDVVAQAASAARSPWVVWIAPGIELAAGWDQEFLQHLQARPDVGSFSPKIASLSAAEGLDDRQQGDEALPHDGSTQPLLASCVIHTQGCHPSYVEDVLGEQWCDRDLHGLTQVLGPTYWAGACRRQLLEDWYREAKGCRFSNGYAELSLGLALKDQGWEHVVSDLRMLASQRAEREIEANFTLSGHAAARLIAKYQAGSWFGKVARGLRHAIGELGSSVLQPAKFRVAIERLSCLGMASDTSASARSTHFADDPTVASNDPDAASVLTIDNETSTPNVAASSASSRRRTRRAA